MELLWVEDEKGEKVYLVKTAEVREQGATVNGVGTYPPEYLKWSARLLYLSLTGKDNLLYRLLTGRR